MTLINSFISWFVKKRIHQIELFKKYPNEVQYENLKQLLDTAEDTEWGEKYDFNSIKTLSDFKNRIPINNYDSLKKDIDRTRRGEQNILWPTEIKWFAKSSGTTNDKSKYIPVSNESLEDCHFKGGKDLISLYLNNYPESNVFDGRGLVMGGSCNISEINNSSYYDGDLSAILIQNLPFWAQILKTPNSSIALMDEWESKINKIAHETIGHNVTNISGVPSWTLVLMKKILEITKANNIKEVWPNLEVFFHGGVSFVPYETQYNKLIPKGEINYFETYNASEGFFAIQDDKNSDDMLLMLDYGIYYEFIPVNELDNDNPTTLTLDQVEKGKNYALLITTNGGLWRYLIGDTVTFTSISPYKIKITGRTKNFINLVGEELIIDNAEKALDIACKKTGGAITDYTAAPINFSDKENAGHEWLIEFSIQPKNIDFFTETFDNALKSVNSDYEAKRYKNMVLKKPLVRNLPKKTFYKWMKQKGKLGGQNKVPRLSNNRKYIDAILKTL
ncbi:MAG: GH3 auxin-responsive promoter family protein [Bacteroidota bacterium]|nr:GH3 auxin-responsive promoter family protein [Bacteroidota bacterium]